MLLCSGNLGCVSLCACMYRYVEHVFSRAVILHLFKLSSCKFQSLQSKTVGHNHSCGDAEGYGEESPDQRSGEGSLDENADK